MKEKRTAPVEADTTTRAMQSGIIPKSNSIKSYLSRQVIHLLPRGAKNAMTARELALMCNCQTRQITREIEKLRLLGVPICAGVHGYYYPSDAIEFQRYLRRFDTRMRNMSNTRYALDRVMCAISGQMRID